MKDAAVKRSLEELAWAQKMLSREASQRQMIALSKLVTTPSTAHVFVLEAVAIVLTENERAFKAPGEHVSAITWQATKVMLSNPVGLVERMRYALRL
jgi:hypothetical protein